MRGTLPDLLLSGVNRGQNVAEDVTYSGTIAGAMEGTILGIPSIALSQAYGPSGRDAIRWDCAEAHAPALIKRLMEAKIERDKLVNINFPDCAPEDVKGVAVTAQGKRDQELLGIDSRIDGRGNPYYWLPFERRRSVAANGTDLWAVADKRISITPLKLDLTDEPTLTKYAQLFG
jgi:5'/3'-nucleotidase